MGAGGLGIVKYSFRGQNSVVLAIISYFLVQITNQNGAVLDKGRVVLDSSIF